MAKESPEDYAKRKFAWWVNQVQKLLKLNAPKCVIASAIVRGLYPALIRRLNIVEEVSQQMAQLIGEGLAFKTCMCRSCLKAPATCGDDGDLCASCLAAIDAMTADMDIDGKDDAANELLKKIMDDEKDEKDDFDINLNANEE